jgi:hypothetical protein
VQPHCIYSIWTPSPVLKVSSIRASQSVLPNQTPVCNLCTRTRDLRSPMQCGQLQKRLPLYPRHNCCNCNSPQKATDRQCIIGVKVSQEFRLCRTRKGFAPPSNEIPHHPPSLEDVLVGGPANISTAMCFMFVYLTAWTRGFKYFCA